MRVAMLRNGLEPWHLLVVVLVVVLLFGSAKLPVAARALGKSMRILKSEAAAMRSESAAQAGPGGDAAGADAGPVAKLTPDFRSVDGEDSGTGGSRGVPAAPGAAATSDGAPHPAS
jgi:sec-independent protein translocase protein TatA